MKEGERNKKKSIAHCPLFSLWWVRSLLQKKEGKGLGAAGSACPEPGPPQGEWDSRGFQGELTPWGQQWALRGAGSTHSLPALSTLLLPASPRNLHQAEPRAAPSRQWWQVQPLRLLLASAVGPHTPRGFPGVTSGKESACKRRKRQQFRALGREDLLEKGLATPFSILAWRIPMDGGAWPAMVRRARLKRNHTPGRAMSAPSRYHLSVTSTYGGHHD